MPEQTSELAVHWGGDGVRPTSLHGNGAKALGLTTLLWPNVTCRLCLSLRGSDDVPCPDRACGATDQGACRYPRWVMCMHPPESSTPPGSYFATHCDSPREDREMSDLASEAYEDQRDGWWG